MGRLTHGGGIVFKLTSEGPRYLLVEASGTRDRWVFPKGHIEDGETATSAALREVGEEAGVRARLVRRLRPVEHKKEGEPISILYFLMAYAGRTRPLDKRRVRWLTFDDALEALDRGKSRRVLRSADRLISAATAAEPRRYRFSRALGHVAEWLALGALALLFVAPIPPIAALAALPAGMVMSLALRVLLRPLRGVVPGNDHVTLPRGDDRLRLLVGGAQWLTRTDYLGGPIRICAALTVLLPVLAVYWNLSALLTLVAALPALAWWKLERRRASLLAYFFSPSGTP